MCVRGSAGLFLDGFFCQALLFRRGQLGLEIRVLHHLIEDRLAENPSRGHIAREMLPGQGAIVADLFGLGDQRVLIDSEESGRSSMPGPSRGLSGCWDRNNCLPFRTV